MSNPDDADLRRLFELPAGKGPTPADIAAAAWITLARGHQTDPMSRRCTGCGEIAPCSVVIVLDALGKAKGWV